jgi:uncharacterized protein YjbI with pentapeptide repeats
MARLPAADCIRLHGLPELWVIVLDQLAHDDAIRDVRAALHRHLETLLPDSTALERAQRVCLAQLAAGQVLTQLSFLTELSPILRHEPVRIALASERMAADLQARMDCAYLGVRLPRELIESTANAIKDDEAAITHLRQLVNGPLKSHAMAASLLLAVKSDWRPAWRVRILEGAYLANARWNELRLPHASLSDADLSGADLSQARLDHCLAIGAIFRQARLHAASLHRSVFERADLTQADLSAAEGQSAAFDGACLVRMNADGARFSAASFARADLTDASFRQTDLQQATFFQAKLAGTNFAGANLTGAELPGVCLRRATLAGACLRAAKMSRCDLEYMEWAGAELAQANLEQALLTGTVMPGANFQGACLSGAYLADVEWEGAVLRGADLRGASFHMGSSRSGLIFSPIACEGSRTGFYTDEFEEQAYKAPEEIRKANLCGADLRGAKIDNVDFYLVDLRGAKLDANQADHVRRCGAILCSRR